MSNGMNKTTLEFRVSDLGLARHALSIGSNTAVMCGHRAAEAQLDRLVDEIGKAMRGAPRVFREQDWAELCEAVRAAGHYDSELHYSGDYWRRPDKIVVMVGDAEFSTAYGCFRSIDKLTADERDEEAEKVLVAVRKQLDGEVQRAMQGLPPETVTFKVNVTDLPMIGDAFAIERNCNMMSGRKAAKKIAENYRIEVEQKGHAVAALFDGEVWAELGVALEAAKTWDIVANGGGRWEAPKEIHVVIDGTVFASEPTWRLWGFGKDRERTEKTEAAMVALEGVLEHLAPMDCVRRAMAAEDAPGLR